MRDISSPADRRPGLSDAALTGQGRPDPELTDPSLTGSSLTDPSLTGSSLTDPSLTDPSLADSSLGDSSLAAFGLPDPTRSEVAGADPSLATPNADSGWGPRAVSLDLIWVLLWLLGLIGIVIFARWRAAPYYLIWVGFALLYSLRMRRAKAASWPLAAMVVITFAAIGADAASGTGPASELADVPLMAAMFWVMLWHADRRLAAGTERARAGERSARQLATQSRFLQDVSHQLRTPITIALGHAELLARSLADGEQQRDIHVVVGELNRLARLSERLLLIAASENPDFLRPEPVALRDLAVEALLRWQPAAPRNWQLGQLDGVVVSADAERLGLAVDSLLENAVQHTGPDDLIRVSVTCGQHTQFAHMIIEDSGAGIPEDALTRIFDRFTTGSSPGGHQGTGLGLALVCAVMRGHGGEVLVQSAPRQGSRFELLLPVQAVEGPDRSGDSPAELTASAPGSSGQRCGSGRGR